MPRYRSSGWSGLSLRFLASLVVFAIAALSGAVIGGVSVYIINDAINPPPPALASTDGSGSSGPKQPQAQDSKSPAAVVQPQSSPKPIVPAASQTMPQNESHAPMHAATQAATQDTSQQAAQKPSDALSRTHATEASAPAADSASHGAQAKTSDEADTKSGPTRTTDNQTDTARKKAAGVAKKRVTRRSAPETSEQAQSAPQHSYYDYYDRDAPHAQRGFNQSRPRVIVRRQDNYDYGWDDRNREADRFPAQSRPSFFGPFGGGRYNNRDDDW